MLLLIVSLEEDIHLTHMSIYLHIFIYFLASLDSTAQTGHANGADLQEEVYQKVICHVFFFFSFFFFFFNWMKFHLWQILIGIVGNVEFRWSWNLGLIDNRCWPTKNNYFERCRYGIKGKASNLIGCEELS